MKRVAVVLLALLFAAPAMAATNYVRYVDPDAQDTSGNCKSAALTPDGNGDYACKSLNLAEALGGVAGHPPLNLTTASDTYTIECQSASANHTVDSTAVTVSGWTTNATYNVTIRAATADRAGKSWSDTKYRLAKTITSNNAAVLTLTSTSTVADGLQVRTNSNSTTNNNAIAGSGSCIVKNCYLLADFVTSSYASRAFNGSGASYLINCICIGRSTSNSASGASVYFSSGVSYAYGCVIVGGYYGLRATIGTTIKNSYCYGANTVDISSSASLTIVTTATTDTTGDPAGLDSVAYSTANFTNVTAGSEDFTLVAGSALLNSGTDTSGEAAPLNFTTDMLGVTRGVGGAWDVGPLEYNPTASGMPWIPAAFQGGPI